MNCQTKRFMEELSALLLLAGGRNFSCEELFNMKLGDVFEMSLPNGVSLKSFPTKDHPIFGEGRNNRI